METVPNIMKADDNIENQWDIVNFLKARYRNANVDNFTPASVSHIGRIGSKFSVSGVVRK